MEETDLYCPVCYQEFNQTLCIPKVFPQCGHTICSECIKNISKSTSVLKCPIDKEIIQLPKNGPEGFPLNYILNQILEKSTQKEICEEHQEKMRFLCVTDKVKICEECVCLGRHEGHEIKSMKKIQCEANMKKRELEEKISGLQSCCLEKQKVLFQSKTLLEEEVKQQFKKLRTLLKKREKEIRANIQEIFQTGTEKLGQVLKNDSKFRVEIQNKITEFDDIFKHENLFGILKQDISPLISNLDALLTQLSFSISNIESKESIKDFQDAVVDFENSIPKLDCSLKSFSEQIETFCPKDLEDFCSLETVHTNPDFEVSTNLKFKVQDSCLEISALLDEKPVQMTLNVNQWKNIREAKIIFKHYNFTNEDKQALNFVMKRLTNLKKLETYFSPQEITDNFLLEYFPIIYSKVTELEEFILSLATSQITDKSAMIFTKNYLSQMKNLKSLNLDLSCTKITEKTIQSIVKDAVKVISNLENLELYLSDVCINDKLGLQLFTISMPKVEKLKIGFSGTKITDKTVEAFNKLIISRADKLKVLAVDLSKTMVSDLSLTNMLPICQKVQKFNLNLEKTNVTDSFVNRLMLNLPKKKSADLSDFEINLQKTKISLEGIARFEVARRRNCQKSPK